MSVTLSQMQQRVDKYIDQFTEGYFPPMSLVVRLTEELGELAREVNHQFGEKRKKPTEPEGSITLELGDILFVLICLANELQIDLSGAFSNVMDKYETRDKYRWTHKSSDSSKR